MNLVLLLEDDFDDVDRVRLTGRRHRHVTEVHRAKTGETLRVGMLNGRVGTARIVRIDERSVEMVVSLDTEPPPPLPLTLLLALPRPKVLRRVLQSAATLGVTHVVLMKTWRVEKSYWQTPLLEPRAIRDELILGLEQAGATALPHVTIEKRFRPFVEDRLPALATDTLRLLAHPHAGKPCPRAVGSPVTLAVGPEGGFVAYELAALEDAGFESVSVGPRILRVEQVLPLLVGRLF